MDLTKFKINDRVFIRVGGLKIQVAVLDLRVAFGRLDLKVSPVHGDGEKWVNSENVEVS